MQKFNSLSIQEIKTLGKEKSEENLNTLLELYYQEMDIELKREVVSSIGRQNNINKVILFLEKEALEYNKPMELIYQMYRTCLIKMDLDKRFTVLEEKIRLKYDNEVIAKMKANYDFRHKNKKIILPIHKIDKPLLLVGDSEQTLQQLPVQSIQLVFTSPPYYNAREYSDYCSYHEYLAKMNKIFRACQKVLEDGRFLIVNVSPVITKRPGREFESIRYPIHFDLHSILEQAGFYFIDEIIWIKPEACVPNRVGGYQQSRKPLSYKPNCITESIMVYRKKCDFLLDKNINMYDEKSYDKYENESIDTTNCWHIAPKSDKDHPAVFPEELCRRILKYYSFKKDVVLDPFAGSGTLGRVAYKMGRIPILCEINQQYIDTIHNRSGMLYEIRR